MRPLCGERLHFSGHFPSYFLTSCFPARLPVYTYDERNSVPLPELLHYRIYIYWISTLLAEHLPFFPSLPSPTELAFAGNNVYVQPRLHLDARRANSPGAHRSHRLSTWAGEVKMLTFIQLLMVDTGRVEAVFQDGKDEIYPVPQAAAPCTRLLGQRQCCTF